MSDLVLSLAPSFWATQRPADLIAFARSWDRADVALLLEDPDASDDLGPWLWDPSTAIGALIAVTQHLRLILPVAPAYTDPVTAARRVGSLDNLSGGRIGWVLDLATSPERDRKTRAVSHAIGSGNPLGRARELVEASRAIWDSWAPEAFRADKAANILVDESLVREVDFKGVHFHVQTTSNLRRPPQGNPPLYISPRNAGEERLAVEIADIVLATDPVADAGHAVAQTITPIRISSAADLARLSPRFGESHVA